METGISYKAVDELMKQVALPHLIYKKMKEKGTTAKQLSESFGRNRGYLYKQLTHSDQFASLLLLLSNHLQCNLFEPFVNLLPEDLRTTQRESVLQEKITALQKTIEDVSKERDIYKSLLVK